MLGNVSRVETSKLPSAEISCLIELLTENSDVQLVQQSGTCHSSADGQWFQSGFLDTLAADGVWPAQQSAKHRAGKAAFCQDQLCNWIQLMASDFNPAFMQGLVGWSSCPWETWSHSWSRSVSACPTPDTWGWLVLVEENGLVRPPPTLSIKTIAAG